LQYRNCNAPNLSSDETGKTGRIRIHFNQRLAVAIKKNYTQAAVPMDSARQPNSRLIRNLILFFLPGMLTATVIFMLWQMHPDPQYWIGLAQAGRAYMELHPWALILALSILPGLGFPVSPLLILFGIVIGPIYGLPLACLIGITAQTICTIWTYALAAGPLRGLLAKYVLRNKELPTLTDRNALRLGLIMRITPGMPYAVQNVILGVMRLKFKTYLLVSIPITSLYTIGFIVTGGAIFEGSIGTILAAVLLIITLILLTRILLSRTQKNVG
jgi:uncharacterized membrane protein YdjX (TVP38/TMEM64 family)